MLLQKTAVDLVGRALERLEGEHAGKYFPLALLPDEDQEELRENTIFTLRKV